MGRGVSSRGERGLFQGGGVVSVHGGGGSLFRGRGFCPGGGGVSV